LLPLLLLLLLLNSLLLLLLLLPHLRQGARLHPCLLARDQSRHQQTPEPQQNQTTEGNQSVNQ
jgi:hypothetical protein